MAEAACNRLERESAGGVLPFLLRRSFNQHAQWRSLFNGRRAPGYRDEADVTAVRSCRCCRCRCQRCRWCTHHMALELIQKNTHTKWMEGAQSLAPSYLEPSAMPIDVFKHLLSGDQLLRPSRENECATDQPGAGTGFFRPVPGPISL